MRVHGRHNVVLVQQQNSARQDRPEVRSQVAGVVWRFAAAGALVQIDTRSHAGVEMEWMDMDACPPCSAPTGTMISACASAARASRQ